MSALVEQGKWREPSERNHPPENRVTLQLALRTLCGIRRRYEMERAAHPDTRLHSVHVAWDDSDMVWITAVIEAFQNQSLQAQPKQLDAQSKSHPET